MALPRIHVGSPLEISLEQWWNDLLDKEEYGTVPSVLGKINSFLGQLRRNPASISSNMEAVKRSGQPSLANYLGSLEYIDGTGSLRGPWSFMTENEWQFVANILSDECSTRDAEAAMVDFTWLVK